MAQDRSERIPRNPLVSTKCITFTFTGKNQSDSFLLRWTTVSLSPGTGLGSGEGCTLRLGWISCRDDHRSSVERHTFPVLVGAPESDLNAFDVFLQ